MPTVYNPGLRHMGAYQVSGYPYLRTYTLGNTAGSGVSEQKLEFLNVTKQIVITNSETSTNRDLRVHFVSTGSTANVIANKHFYDVPNNTSLTLDVKCKEIYFSNASGGNITFSVFASQTHVKTGSMYELTGSGINV